MDEARGQSSFNDRILLDRGKGGLGNSLKGQRAEKEKEQEQEKDKKAAASKSGGDPTGLG